MTNEYTVDKRAETRTVYTFTERNSKGEEIAVEICESSANPKDKNSMPYLWKKNGYIDRVVSNWLSVMTYATDERGGCLGLYNPQHTKAGKINFDWILDNTEANKQKILNEVYRLANLG